MYLYEKAITKDLDNIFKNSKVNAIIADSLNDGLKRIAAENEDKVTLPLIVLTGGDWTIADTNFYSLMHGSQFKESDGSYLKYTNVIPITASYDMYIVAQSSRECDMLTREILFHYNMNPTLTIDIPYGIDKLHTFNILFGSNIRKTQNYSGLVYRVINLTLQGAYLWHNNTFDYLKDAEIKKVTSKIDESALS